VHVSKQLSSLMKSRSYSKGICLRNGESDTCFGEPWAPQHLHCTKTVTSGHNAINCYWNLRFLNASRTCRDVLSRR
jgi:hypothetical protein